jgi:predicted RNase H-like HicB family nuclease
MNYHFKLHKEKNGYWAECCELEGCRTQGDTPEALNTNCKEALEVYLYEPGESERTFPLPDDSLDGKKCIIKIPVEPKRALAILLRNYRLNANMTQKQVAEMPGMKNLYSYQRLEKEPNATLNIVGRIHKVFPEIKLEYLFQ